MTDTQVEWVLVPSVATNEMILGIRHYIPPEAWGDILAARPPIPSDVLDAMVERGFQPIAKDRCAGSVCTTGIGACRCRRYARACILAALGESKSDVL